MKTTAQQLLEAKRNKPIREIILDSLEKHQATRWRGDMARDCSEDLGISYVTLYKWARSLDIKVGDYHRQYVAS